MSTTLLKALRIFIDPFPGHFQAVILRDCRIHERTRTFEPHDFYRPSARLDNTHRSARRPTIGSPLVADYLRSSSLYIRAFSLDTENHFR